MAHWPFALLGRIVKTHGLKGEVSVQFDYDFSLEELTGLDVWLVPPPASLSSARIRSVRVSPKSTLVALHGVDDIASAESLVGTRILARTADLPPDLANPAESSDPRGLAITDIEHGPLGTVINVIVTGANDVWVLDGPFGEVLLPVIDNVVLGIDWSARAASVRVLPGILAEPKDTT
jgi:16S rRNA processing protein RimM